MLRDDIWERSSSRSQVALVEVLDPEKLSSNLITEMRHGTSMSNSWATTGGLLLVWSIRAGRGRRPITWQNAWRGGDLHARDHILLAELLSSGVRGERVGNSMERMLCLLLLGVNWKEKLLAACRLDSTVWYFWTLPFLAKARLGTFGLMLGIRSK